MGSVVSEILSLLYFIVVEKFVCPSDVGSCVVSKTNVSQVRGQTKQFTFMEQRLQKRAVVWSRQA